MTFRLPGCVPPLVKALRCPSRAMLLLKPSSCLEGKSSELGRAWDSLPVTVRQYLSAPKAVPPAILLLV